MTQHTNQLLNDLPIEGPVFSRGERFRDPEDAWLRLPALGAIAGVPIRWIGPLVEIGIDLGDFSAAAYGYLGERWLESIRGIEGPFLEDDDQIDPEWASGLLEAARYLAEEGTHAGPENRVERWLAWLCFELSAPHDAVRSRAQRLGVDQ